MKRVMLLLALLLPACGEPTTPVAERPIADAPGWVVKQTATVKAVLWVEYDGTISLIGRYSAPDSASQEDE